MLVDLARYYADIFKISVVMLISSMNLMNITIIIFTSEELCYNRLRESLSTLHLILLWWLKSENVSLCQSSINFQIINIFWLVAVYANFMDNSFV